MSDNYTKYFHSRYKNRLQEYITSEFNYRVLSRKIRLIACIAASQASVKAELLKGFINWGFASGIKPVEIYEVLLQGYLFCGYPAALESFFVYNEALLDDKNQPENNRLISEIEWDYNLFRRRGLKAAKNIYGKNFSLVHNNIRKLSPELASSMIIEGYGRVISRTGLDILPRELAIVAALSVTGMSRQLYSHIRGAINVGAPPRQIKAIIKQSRLFISKAKVKKALKVFEKSLGIQA